MKNLNAIYQSLVESRKIESNEAQKALVARLSVTQNEIMTQKKNFFSFLKKDNSFIQGLYIYGEVGRGKTFLMDLFYENLDIKHKKRYHFHEFMNEMQEKIHEFRQREKTGEVKGDPIAFVAGEIAKTTRVLCFDEFSVVDIADAMILGRLFEKFFAAKIVIVATSNVKPENLYKTGLNRALFLPFIAMIEEKCEVLSLESRTDYRLEKLSGADLWIVPPLRTKLDKFFLKLTGEVRGKPVKLPHKGRFIHVPQAASGVARFDFKDLCEVALAASDYLIIAHHYHTVVIDDIPRISYKNRDHAKRFINLIDALYDNRVKLVASSFEGVLTLYEGGDGFETFEFARTQSRLIEMRSLEYMALPHGRADKLSDIPQV